MATTTGSITGGKPSVTGRDVAVPSSNLPAFSGVGVTLLRIWGP